MLSMTATDTLFKAGWTDAALVTVSGKKNDTSWPLLKMPDDVVMERTPAETAAEATGEPVVGAVNSTVLWDKLCGALPIREITMDDPETKSAYGMIETKKDVAVAPLPLQLR